VRVLRRSPELVAVLADIAHPAIVGYLPVSR
jgi:hypothetical protein